MLFTIEYNNGRELSFYKKDVNIVVMKYSFKEYNLEIDETINNLLEIKTFSWTNTGYPDWHIYSYYSSHFALYYNNETISPKFEKKEPLQALIVVILTRLKVL